ncbi:MAG: hypothetical protein IJS24_09835 [Eubacterium sp.]|nr:hypothetical protein [Eubacterium sp.]MBR0119223.1 hypothetical protein [Eubacterium sp.]
MNNENNKTNQDLSEEPKRPTSHRVIAWVVIVLLVSMYTITFISAISGGGSTSALFMMSLGSTIFIPCLLWGYLCLWRWSVKRSRKKIMQSMSMSESGADEASGDASDSIETEKTDAAE